MSVRDLYKRLRRPTPSTVQQEIRKWRDLQRQIMEQLNANQWQKAIPAPDFPTGKVLHKGSAEYHSLGCDRYLIVEKEVWIRLDVDDTPLETVTEPDWYGRIHWEDQCPNHHP